MKAVKEYTEASAVIDGPHRYILTRVWSDSPTTCCFVMLNPSTADGSQDDPTIRKCVKFAQRWGCGKLVVVNLFSIRAADPSILKRTDVPFVGPLNDQFIELAMAQSDIVVCAWGNYGGFQLRGDQVREQLRALRPDKKLYAFDITRVHQPKHPLYVRDDAPLIEF